MPHGDDISDPSFIGGNDRVSHPSQNDRPSAMEMRFDSGMNRPNLRHGGSGIGQPFENEMVGDSTEIGGIEWRVLRGEPYYAMDPNYKTQEWYQKLSAKDKDMLGTLRVA